ncbi:MAG: TetR/AcrR family transcriptional regulator [Eubacteriales bacterium]|nr:TetR/AcrR family transcriptional regulator [Eubacteriales bacterium]
MRLSFEKLPPEKQASILAAGIREFANKPYADASTDTITANCAISKGLLFHYFGSKREFYLYCLSKSLERLMTKTADLSGAGFYDTLFSAMDNKFRLCMEYPDEMHLINMSSREGAAEVFVEKNNVLKAYVKFAHMESMRIMQGAISALSLKALPESLVLEGFSLYFNAILNKYLSAYQENPDEFFNCAESIKTEMREYLDLILYGVCKEVHHVE